MKMKAPSMNRAICGSVIERLPIATGPGYVETLGSCTLQNLLRLTRISLLGLLDVARAKLQ